MSLKFIAYGQSGDSDGPRRTIYYSSDRRRTLNRRLSGCGPSLEQLRRKNGFGGRIHLDDFGFQWLVRPILQHLPRNSMVATVQKTRDTVCAEGKSIGAEMADLERSGCN